MKVLFIAGADQQYGTFHMSKSLLDPVRSRKNNIEYVVFTQVYGPLNEWCEENGIENYVFPYRYCVYYPFGNPIKSGIKHLLKYIQVTASNRRALRQLAKSGIMARVDLIHTNINRDLFGILVAKRYNLPNITHLREFSRAHFGLKLIYRNQIDLMNRYSARFVAISNAVGKDWADYGLQEEKIEVIYDGVDVDRYRPRRAARQKDSPLKMVMCGAIYEGKGQRELLEATLLLLEEGLDIELDFYGNPTNEAYYDGLRQRVDESHCQDRIRFRGFRENLHEVLCDYDVGVVCSKAEGFGLVTVEYMLCDLDVVASDTGANPEILGNGRYGQLYPIGDVGKLRQAIAKVYDSGISRECLTEAREYARGAFSLEKTSKAMNRLYQYVAQAARNDT